MCCQRRKQKNQRNTPLNTTQTSLTPTKTTGTIINNIIPKSLGHHHNNNAIVTFHNAIISFHVQTSGAWRNIMIVQTKIGYLKNFHCKQT
jgi:hypothetical protein